jgi:uncharacterized protein YndB with AHSA1/START domain
VFHCRLAYPVALRVKGGFVLPSERPTAMRHHRRMATVELSVTIRRPLGDVYRVLTTPESTPRWSSNAVEEHTTTEGPIRVGSRRRATVRRLGGGTTQNEIEVTALEPERSIAVRSVEAPVPFSSSWTFTPVDGATRVDWHWDFAMRGWLRPFGGLLTRSFSRTFRRDLDRLKSMMESGEL